MRVRGLVTLNYCLQSLRLAAVRFAGPPATAASNAPRFGKFSRLFANEKLLPAVCPLAHYKTIFCRPGSGSLS